MKRHKTQTKITVSRGYEVNTLYIMFLIIRQPVSISVNNVSDNLVVHT